LAAAHRGLTSLSSTSRRTRHGIAPGPGPGPALHLLAGLWVASCPTCGHQLASARTPATLRTARRPPHLPCLSRGHPHGCHPGRPARRLMGAQVQRVGRVATLSLGVPGGRDQRPAVGPQQPDGHQWMRDAAVVTPGHGERAVVPWSPVPDRRADSGAVEVDRDRVRDRASDAAVGTVHAAVAAQRTPTRQSTGNVRHPATAQVRPPNPLPVDGLPGTARAYPRSAAPAQRSSLLRRRWASLN
jgi:hypothetical protein